MSGTIFWTVNAIACSDVGRVRAFNEDAFCVADLSEGLRIEKSGALRFISGPQGALFALADGMGGAAGGETASRLAVRILYRKLQELIRDMERPDNDFLEEIVIDAVAAANRTIFDLARHNPELTGMGTTLTAVLEIQNRLVTAQIGDSRAYLLREDGIRQLTRDQSLVADLVSIGQITEEQARRHPERNILLQALGVASKVELQLGSTNIRPSDVLLLCSDGLYTQMSADEIFDVVADSRSPEDACQELINLANSRGGTDNITCVLVEFSSKTEKQRLPKG
jgi:serine/threonine protein phosphatase PrpC